MLNFYATNYRKLGEHNGQTIFINSLHIDQTYGGMYIGSGYLPNANKEILANGVRNRVEKLYGANTKFHLASEVKIDPTRPLPQEIVITQLDCLSKKNKDEKDIDGSSLILVWFQNSDEDTFKNATLYFKEIDWKKEAEDYEP